jgi:LmbE family N-acetylglucosaminyl deacetylase
MPSVLIVVAHPDDAEVKAAGTTALWARQGFRITFGIMTDGSAGHQSMAVGELIRRREAEAREGARRLGAEVEMLGYPDGLLTPSLEARLDVIRLIRRVQPDLVLTHRPADYHPDHRYTGQLVQDAAYMVTVPRIASDTPALSRNPIFGYLSDRFSQPVPFRPDVVVPIDSVLDRVIDSLDAHESQFYEWLPFNMGIIEQVPADPAARPALLRDWFLGRYALRASEFPAVGDSPKGEFVEAFEISEYGAPLTAEARARLFPFAGSPPTNGHRHA